MQFTTSPNLVRELRKHLREKLPDYMMPSTFTLLDAFPLTPNGKTDRNALPKPIQAPELAGDYFPPRTFLEKQIASIWRETLKLDEIGINDNFLELGGHSLLATQIISGLRELFGLELPLRSLFESPTIAQLAEKIQAVSTEQPSPAPSIASAPRNANLPLSFAQQSLWIIHQLSPDSSAYNI